jgi:hypothetical protein
MKKGSKEEMNDRWKKGRMEGTMELGRNEEDEI